MQLSVILSCNLFRLALSSSILVSSAYHTTIRSMCSRSSMPQFLHISSAFVVHGEIVPILGRTKNAARSMSTSFIFFFDRVNSMSLSSCSFEIFSSYLNRIRYKYSDLRLDTSSLLVKMASLILWSEKSECAR